MTTIRARDGDTISDLLLLHLGRNDDEAEEALHEANPDLVYHGPVLSSGVEINLPVLPEKKAAKVENVWD